MRKLKKLLSLYRAVDGVSSFCSAALLARSGRWGPQDVPSKTFRVRDLHLPLNCRPGTSDYATFVEVFVEDEYGLAAQFVALPVRSVLDLGANIGMAAAYFHRLWPAARLCLVEPDARNAAVAEQTFQYLIQSGKVVVRRNCVGSRSRAVRLKACGDANEFRMSDDLEGFASESEESVVRVLTVDEILDSACMDTVDLIKCDIEGAEVELFEDCRSWIHRTRYLVAELHDGINADWLVRKLRAAGASPKVLHTACKPIEGLSVVWMDCGGN